MNGEIIETVTLYMKNVNEMKLLLKKGELENTQLTFNASVGTADDGEEVTYDDDHFSLQINEGTILDIVDGMHRVKAAELALAEKPDIDFYFDLKILNLTVDRAAQYLAQISKGEKISKTKQKMMAKESLTDLIIAELRKSSLGNRISKDEMLKSSIGELVTYNTLFSTTEKYFSVTKRGEMFVVADYLKDFFDILLESYQDEFNDHYKQVKEKSLINNNITFAGYVVLASKMKNKDIEAYKVMNYLEDIDFSKDNPQWVEHGVLDEQKRLTKKAKEKMEEFFQNIEV